MPANKNSGGGVNSNSSNNNNSNKNGFNSRSYHQSLSVSSGNLLNNNNNISNSRHISKGLQTSSSASSLQQQQQLQQQSQQQLSFQQKQLHHLSYSSAVTSSGQSVGGINHQIGNNNNNNINSGNGYINFSNNQMPMFISNGPSSFPPSLRKFRHIKSIVGRNLESSPNLKSQSPHPILYSCYFTLHAPPYQPNYSAIKNIYSDNNDNNNDEFDDENDSVINTTPNKEEGLDGTDTENILLNDEISESGIGCGDGGSNIDSSTTPTPTNKYQYQDEELEGEDEENSYYDGELDEGSDEDDLPPPFYTSEVVPYSNNPLWNPFDCYKQLPMDILDNFCSFNICVWDKDNEDLPPIYQCDIDLTQLEFIATEIKHFSNLILPSNTIIFELKDGFYITRETKCQMANSPNNLNDIQKIINNEKRKAITGSKQLFLCIVSKKLYNNRSQENSSVLAKEIEDRLERNSEYLEKLRELENQRNRTNLLREEAIVQQGLLERDQNKFNQLKHGLVPKSVQLTKASIIFYKSFRQLIKNTEILKMDLHLLKKLRVSWERKKWNLITQIRTIYPIGQGNKLLTINSLPLPNSDYNGFDEEQIATALGYVCHILHLTSKYLDIPLRYPMTPMGSRSFIKDEISHHQSSKFPLYSKGVEKRIFDYAVFLLNKNLEQLLNSQGLYGNFLLKETLPNVQILLGKSKLNELSNQLLNNNQNNNHNQNNQNNK